MGGTKRQKRDKIKDELIKRSIEKSPWVVGGALLLAFAHLNPARALYCIDSFKSSFNYFYNELIFPGTSLLPVYSIVAWQVLFTSL